MNLHAKLDTLRREAGAPLFREVTYLETKRVIVPALLPGQDRGEPENPETQDRGEPK